MSEVRLLDLELKALRKKVKINTLIHDFLFNNRTSWIIAETVVIFWNNREWCVNKLTKTDLIEHSFIEEDLDVAIEQFLEIAQFDNIGNTDEEAALSE